MTSLFIFRLDLRVVDNIGLIQCFQESNKIIPCFIFDDQQINREKNLYFSNNCVQFMIESLKELHQECDNKLLFFYGNTPKIVKYLIKKLEIDSVYLNKDYTPFSIKRDKMIEELCSKAKVAFKCFDDIILNPIDSTMKDDGEPYSTFTNYYNKARQLGITLPNTTQVTSKFINIDTKLQYSYNYKKLGKFYDNNEDINVNGGRTLALQILKNISNQKNYNKERSLCAYKSTQLSAYIKFGCVSIREVFHKFLNTLGPNNDLIKQLYWREFYYNLIYHYPKTYTHKMGLKEIYSKFPWSHNKQHFEAWCNGETGFPIVDASMKHLNKTGYMPNRSRLIVANFLTKILRIDWTWGEKYFACALVDYSPSNNLGNWQWVASIGADYQNRIYNPASQSLKSDSECLYIKHWLPVLKDVPNKDIHNWHKVYNNYDINYSQPIIVYTEEYKKSKQLFSNYK